MQRVKRFLASCCLYPVSWWCNSHSCYDFSFSQAISSNHELHRIMEFMDVFHRPIKAKAKRLKLLRFEIWFWFCLQVKNNGGGGGLRGNKPNQLGPYQWANLKHWATVPMSEQISNTEPPGPVFEINSLIGTQLIRFIAPQPAPLFFTWRRNQNEISKRSNFNLLAFVFIARGKNFINSIILNTNRRQSPLASTYELHRLFFHVENVWEISTKKVSCTMSAVSIKPRRWVKLQL